MNELTINLEEQTISARDLHRKLNVKTAYKDWFPRMCEYGFEEGKDFCSKMSESTGGRRATDAEITIQMAKEICMIQRTPEGKRVRQYLIKVEEAWNKPELVMARALKMANSQIDALKENNQKLLEDAERMKPKEIFADAVTASSSSILIRDLAKILKQNGVQTGERRLYRWMREHGFIIQHNTRPTQKAMEMGLFEIIENSIQRADLPPIVSMTTKVTGKGQQYFINKFLGGEKYAESVNL